MSSTDAPRFTHEEHDPAVDIEDSVAVRQILTKAMAQFEQFADRVQRVEASLEWTAKVQAMIADFRDEIGELRRKIASAAGPLPPSKVAPEDVDVESLSPLLGLPATVLRLLEEIVTVLIARVYADAPRKDAEAIEAELTELLEQVKGKDR